MDVAHAVWMCGKYFMPGMGGGAGIDEVRGAVGEVDRVAASSCQHEIDVEAELAPTAPHARCDNAGNARQVAPEQVLKRGAIAILGDAHLRGRQAEVFGGHGRSLAEPRSSTHAAVPCRAITEVALRIPYGTNVMRRPRDAAQPVASEWNVCA